MVHQKETVTLMNDYESKVLSQMLYLCIWIHIATTTLVYKAKLSKGLDFGSMLYGDNLCLVITCDPVPIWVNGHQMAIPG